MDWQDYLQPGTEVLRNKLGLTTAADLEFAERRLVTDRLAIGVPGGNFDLDHLRAIHRHLFQDLYEWAGVLRRVDMNKGGLPFMPHDRLELGMADVHRRLEARGRLRGRDRVSFAKAAGEIIGDINHLHPFREGNGRTQLEYLRQLADQAGHDFDARQLDPGRWIQASIAASERGDFAKLAAEIHAALHDRIRARDPRDRER